MEEIRDLYYKQKKLFENENPTLDFEENYEERLPYLKIVDEYVSERYKENPKDIDLVSLLSAIRVLVSYDENYYADVLKDFLEENKDTLSDKDKARIFTNLAFYYENREKAEEYLLEAARLNSPYAETYRGLGLDYFDKYTDTKEKELVRKSLECFSKARELSKDYAIEFSYGALLFENGKYKEAKKVFKELLSEFPNRTRLLLALTYCEYYLGNREEVYNYLTKLKIGQDENYSLHTDEIDEEEVWYLYYALEEYDTFIDFYGNSDNSWFLLVLEHYLYALWVKGECDEFYDLIEEFKRTTKRNIEEVNSEDTWSEEETSEIISDYKNDLKEADELIDKIVNKNYKPEARFSLYPEFGCYLVDCILHKF
ncbi:MAG: hypothetical protein Q3988_00470 [Gemella sp.]|nr:hypothetical protein [Gemella sp.]